MQAWEILTDIYEKGYAIGVEGLKEQEKELYLIQHFIIDFELNALSGFLYNHLAKKHWIPETVQAMRGHNLDKLADYLSQAYSLFSSWSPNEEFATWEDMLQTYDSTQEIEHIETLISKLDDYGLANSSIEAAV